MSKKVKEKTNWKEITIISVKQCIMQLQLFFTVGILAYPCTLKFVSIKIKQMQPKFL